MLFMIIYTYEPDKRAEVIKRRAEKGAMVPEGMKVIGDWSTTGGGRVFKLVDMEDPRLGLAASAAWNDLGKVESIPVMPTEEVMKLLSSR